MLRTLLTSIGCLATWTLPAAGQEWTAQQEAFFEGRIRPVLVEHCYACHDGEAGELQGGLSLSTRADLLRGGDSGPALVPGDAEGSLLLRALRYTDESYQMPPRGKLDERVIADFEAWIRDGAADPRGGASEAVDTGWDLEADRDHWAFLEIRDPHAPETERPDLGELDRFIQARLEAEGLSFNPRADRRTLARRLSFDVTGLPLDPERLERYVSDPRSDEDATAALIDELLASPHYGEHWGRQWLDLVRYADSNGLDENVAMAEAWRYRDYVVRALNADKPYDRFLTEQIAGDLLPEPSDPQDLRDALTATGFWTLGPKMLAEQDQEKMVIDIVDEQLDIATRTFLGMTVSCARCHDHKFDPVPTTDYYALAGILRSTRTMEHTNTVAMWFERELASSDELAARDAWRAERDRARAARDAAREAARGSLAPTWQAQVDRYLLAGAAAARQAVIFEAESFSKGNGGVNTGQWGSPEVAIVHTVNSDPQFLEYTVQVPLAGRYRLEARYASMESRALRLLVDGVEVREDACGRGTGSFTPETQAWESLCELELTAGEHVVRFERGGALPHLDKFAWVPVFDEGPAWPLSTAMAQGLAAPIVRNFAEYLARPAVQPIVAPFVELAGLAGEPETWATRAEVAWADFARRADAGELKLQPLVRGLLDEAPPTSLDDLAARYRSLVLLARRGLESDGAEASPSLADWRRVLTTEHGPFYVHPDELAGLYTDETAEELERLDAELARLEGAAPGMFERALAVEDGRVQDLPVHIRGNHLTLADEATPRGFLSVIDHLAPWEPLPEDESGRLQFAEWLLHERHPLTARVMANRVWQGHFGLGLVAQGSNWGLRGSEPTHPELLDWLATRLREDGWSLKALHRRILNSQTYAQSSEWNPLAAERDPEERLLWRYPRRRLGAEAIRDSLLAVSGLLDPELGGSLMRTGNHGYVTNDQSNNQARYDNHRRSLYQPIIRNAQYGFFTTFDYNDPSLHIDRRPETVVPAQALLMLNSPLVIEASEALAADLIEQVPSGVNERASLAFQRALGRPAKPGEVEGARAFLATALATLPEPDPEAVETPAASDAAPAQPKSLLVGEPQAPTSLAAAGERQDGPGPSAALEHAAWSRFVQVLLASSEFLYVD
jgi:hypothetical protein